MKDKAPTRERQGLGATGYGSGRTNPSIARDPLQPAVIYAARAIRQLAMRTQARHK